MMRRTCLVLGFCVFSAGYGFAQQVDYTRREVGGTVLIVGADTKGAFNTDQSRDALYGFDIHGTYNISRLLGLTANFSYLQNSFGSSSADPTSRLTQFMGGIKLQDNAKTTRFRPFAQGMFGVAHGSNLPRLVQASSSTRTVRLIDGTGPAFVVGGGLDIRLTKMLDLRALQIDYNPGWVGGETFHNLRIGIGLNFRV